MTQQEWTMRRNRAFAKIIPKLHELQSDVANYGDIRAAEAKALVEKDFYIERAKLQNKINNLQCENTRLKEDLVNANYNASPCVQRCADAIEEVAQLKTQAFAPLNPCDPMYAQMISARLEALEDWYNAEVIAKAKLQNEKGR